MVSGVAGMVAPGLVGVVVGVMVLMMMMVVVVLVPLGLLPTPVGEARKRCRHRGYMRVERTCAR